MNEPIDVVYTWVDDSFPGYLDELRRYSSDVHDLNPNRTRDNLQILRFSLRSLERFAPWVNHVHLFTCRPQIPGWLDRETPGLSIVHHDEVMAPDRLPTFNSFSIISHLHLIPGLSRRFIYLEDDMFLLSPAALQDFLASDGRVLVFERGRPTPPANRKPSRKDGPWNRALATTNGLLDARFGYRRRRTVNHVPLLIDRDFMAETLDFWPEAHERTRRSRFRAGDNLVPEYALPQVLLESGRGARASRAECERLIGYLGLENFYPWTAWWLRRLDRRRPVFCTLNDNFGERPNPAVVRLVRERLERWFPERSRFEHSAAEGGGG